MITLDDFEFIIEVVSDSLKDLLQRNESKKDTMYEKIEGEMRGVH
jgi:hypothetical protein